MSDIEQRLRERAAKTQGYIDSSQRVVDLLQPEMVKFKAREGHDVYTVRMAVDHQSSIRTQTKEVADLVEAADTIARLRAANGILEDALQEVGDDYPGSSCQEWCQQQVKAARAALEGEG